jgi:hypothetical protein
MTYNSTDGHMWTIDYEYPMEKQFTPIEAMECRFCNMIVYAIEARYEHSIPKRAKMYLKTKQMCDCVSWRLTIKNLQKETRKVMPLLRNIKD